MNDTLTKKVPACYFENSNFPYFFSCLACRKIIVRHLGSYRKLILVFLEKDVLPVNCTAMKFGSNLQ